MLRELQFRIDMEIFGKFCGTVLSSILYTGLAGTGIGSGILILNRWAQLKIRRLIREIEKRYIPRDVSISCRERQDAPDPARNAASHRLRQIQMARKTFLDLRGPS